MLLNCYDGNNKMFEFEFFSFIFQVISERDKLTCNPKPPVLVKIAPDLTEQDKKDIATILAHPNVNIHLYGHINSSDWDWFLDNFSYRRFHLHLMIQEPLNSFSTE